MVEKEVDILSYLRLFLKHKYLVIITVLLFTLIGFSFYRYEVPAYTASSSLVVESETVGTSYTISTRQNLDAISASARSYSTISTVVNNLNLSDYSIKPEIADIIKYRIKKLMPRWLRNFIGVSEPNPDMYSDIRSLTFYYQRNINIKLKRGNIIQISATAQSPKIAA